MTQIPNAELNHYRIWAKVFQYPDASLPGYALESLKVMGLRCPEKLDEYTRFVEWAQTTDLDTCKEIFMKTFHIQAVCYLDLGYVIFGEDYKRGSFLANMKNEQRLAGNDCGDELSDNLANVLNLLPLLTDMELRDDLVSRVILPALDKMLSEFQSSKMAIKVKILRRKHQALLQEGQANGNIYQYALEGLSALLHKDFQDIVAKPLESASATSYGFESAAADCGSCSYSFIHSKTTKHLPR